VPVRRCVVRVSNVRVLCRSGLAETIGENEAALGAGLWGIKRCVVVERLMRAADLPRALVDRVPHVDFRAKNDMPQRFA